MNLSLCIWFIVYNYSLCVLAELWIKFILKGGCGCGGGPAGENSAIMT